MSIVYPQIRTSADLLKSTIRIEKLIPFLQQQQTEACAMVNSKLYGLLPFWQAMQKASIQPVVGLAVEVEFEQEVVLPLILYAQNTEGYHQLLKISSAISIRKEETLPIKWLAGYAKGCIAVIPALAQNQKWLQAVFMPFVQQLEQIFPQTLYIGIERANRVSEEEYLAVELAEQLDRPIMALHESVFLEEQDQFAYEVATAINHGVKLNDAVHVEKFEHQFVLTAEQWQEKFSDRPQWLQETANVLKSCKVEIELNQVFMPKFPVAEGQSVEALLEERAFAGLQYRLQQQQLPNHYIERLQYELSVICAMGYADYFLIVEDFMRFAREANILTGPGRGSSASSLIAYALQITQVNPLQYDLLFERFLNPERVSLPDIDIDFIDTRRQEVIQYVAKKYGQQYVAQIITFGTLSAKAVARDVARMFNFDSEKLDIISKSIPNRLGITLLAAYEQSEKLRAFIAKSKEHQQWFDAALKLEGLPRNSSVHAAGVVLSPKPLVNIVPIEEGHDGVYITQWPMQEVEQIGLLKMDFLGLRNLTIIDQIRNSIRATHKIEIDLAQIPMHDEATFKLLQQGDTAGIFQLESEGMKKALREIKPTQFLDIVAVNALYRPGPMDFIPIYARRKHGKEPIQLPHPALAAILNETYGVLIYQEQIMRIANVMAGFTIGEADLLRRAVSKKKREILEENEMKFVRGAVKQGYDEQSAKEVYALIVRFADYGFAKSHAVAYSIISYQMAYLKAHYPVNFYAALLTNALGNHEKMGKFIVEAKNKGIEILPPSIYQSVNHFKVEKGKIRFGFSAIKGVPQPVIQRLFEVRKTLQAPFKDIYEMAEKMSAVFFVRKAIEPLIKAGALDVFGKDRAILLATLDGAVKQAELASPSQEGDLLGDSFLGFGKLKYTDAEPMPDDIKLAFEKEVLGIYLSEHPLTKIRGNIPEVSATIEMLNHLNDNTAVVMIGAIQGIRQITTKNGDPMAFVTMQDEFGEVSLTLFTKVFFPLIGRLKEGQFILVDGRVENRFGKIQLKVSSLQILK